MFKKHAFSLFFVTCLVTCLVTLLGFSLLAADELYKQGEPPAVKNSEEVKASLSDIPHFTELAKILSPSVVNISVESEVADDEEGPFPGMRKDPAIPMSSSGSGFIINPDGHIVTNLHVIKDAKEITVRLLDDKTEYKAKTVGVDPMTDMALIKIEPKEKLSAVYLGNSDEVEVGEWVIAIGNQFQLGQTVTAGIVSAKSRRVGGDLGRPYDQFLQTDAPINPGSSGGPLFNTRGQVIGINTAIFSPGGFPKFGGTGFNIGIGFSIPINLAKSVISQLRGQGKVTRGLLGVLIQEIEPDMLVPLGLTVAEGALVSEVKKDSPAESAGFRRRDVIVSFNGEKIKDHNQLPLIVANTKIGSEAQVEILREGKIVVLKPVVGELKEEAKAKASKEKAKADKLGLVVRELTEDEARQLGVGLASGVIVDRVDPGSAADKAHLMKGDLLQELAGVLIGDLAGYHKATEQIKKGSPTLVLVHRKNGGFYVSISLN